MRLSPHFALSEMIVSDNAARAGVDNTPNEQETANLKRLCELILEPLRVHLGHPIIVSSGLRKPVVDWMARDFTKAQAEEFVRQGRPTNSQHVLGQAADFTCPGYGRPLEVCKAVIALGLPFDQLIREFDNGVRGWTHVSWAQKPRGMILTIDGGGTRYGLN